MLKRILHIVLTTLLWVGIVAYFVASSTYARHSLGAEVIDSLHIEIVDADEIQSVSESQVRQWIERDNLRYKQVPYHELNTAEWEYRLRKHVLVKDAAVYVTSDGVVNVSIKQHRPIARVMTSTGYNFLLTGDGHILPPQSGCAMHLPVITGDISFMMPSSYYGDYEQIKKRLIEEYTDNVHYIDSLISQHNSTLASLKDERTDVQSETPSYFSSKESKARFAEDKQRRIDNINKKIASEEGEIEVLVERKGLLAENQKKSAKKYLYLYKLLNFVEFVEGDDFWHSQIVQINVTTPKGYTTPQIEIVPRVGKHIVCLGDIDKGEEQLDKLLLFYREALAWEGWDGYNYIDLRYNDQIVCTK